MLWCFPMDFYDSYKRGAGNAWEMLPHSEPAALLWAPEQGAASQKGPSPPDLLSIAPNRFPAGEAAELSKELHQFLSFCSAKE